MIEFYQDDYFKLAMKLIQDYTLMGIKTNNDSGSSGILINAGALSLLKTYLKFQNQLEMLHQANILN